MPDGRECFIHRGLVEKSDPPCENGYDDDDDVFNETFSKQVKENLPGPIDLDDTDDGFHIGFIGAWEISDRKKAEPPAQTPPLELPK